MDTLSWKASISRHLGRPPCASRARVNKSFMRSPNVQVADQPERRVVLVSPPCNLACHLVSSLPTALSTTVDNKSQGKNYTTHKLLTYLRFDENPSAEFPAIAEGSAHILGTTCAGPDRRWDAPMRRGGSRSTALKHPRSWRATIRRASMPTPVTTGRYHLPVGSLQEPLSERVACRAGRDATHHGWRVPGRVKRWHETCTMSVQR